MLNPTFGFLIIRGFKINRYVVYNAYKCFERVFLTIQQKIFICTNSIAINAHPLDYEVRIANWC